MATISDYVDAMVFCRLQGCLFLHGTACIVALFVLHLRHTCCTFDEVLLLLLFGFQTESEAIDFAKANLLMRRGGFALQDAAAVMEVISLLLP